MDLARSLPYLETKATFIAQVLTGDSTVRQAEDIGGQELAYAEVKAIASSEGIIAVSPDHHIEAVACRECIGTVPDRNQTSAKR